MTKLQQMREARGLTIWELARNATAIPPQNTVVFIDFVIRNFETAIKNLEISGINASAKVRFGAQIERIAKALNCTVDEITED